MCIYIYIYTYIANYIEMCAVTQDCCIITVRCPDRMAIVTYILMKRVCYNAAEIYSDKSNICLVTFCFPCIDLM